jgi:hypothetical protein
MRGLDKYKKILVDVIDLYHEIKSQPHTSNPFIAYYGEVDKELVDLFIKWYRKELGDAIYDIAIPMLIDEHGKVYDFLSYSYNNGWILEFDGSKYGESDLTVKVLDKKGPLK